MKLKLTSAIIVIIAILLAEGCKKPPPPPVNGNGNGGGNGRPPVADAGPDQTITIVTSYTSALLDGSNSYDSSGRPLQFLWRQLSGPSTFLQTPGQKNCPVYNLNSPGVYSFELRVWNSNGLDLDTTDITIVIPTYCQPNRVDVPVTLTYLSDLPEQIQMPEIISAGNKLVLPAWFNNSTSVMSNNVYIYDLVTQSWDTIHASLARMGVATIAAGNKLFFAGGVDGDYIYSATSVVDIYDLTTKTWSSSNLSEARGYCKAVSSGNKIFFAGGLKNDHLLSDKVDIYDLATSSWTSAILPGGPREVGAAVAALNKILFCGGYTLHEDPTGFGYVFTTPSASIDIFDNNNGQWSAQNMQLNKGSFAAIGVNEKLYMAGGLVNNAPTFHVEELNLNTMNSSSTCLHQSTMSYNDKNAIVKDDLIVFFSNTGVDANKFDIYNKQTGLWSIGVLPPNVNATGVFTAIATANNEIYTVIDNKLYKMNL